LITELWSANEIETPARGTDLLQGMGNQASLDLLKNLLERGFKP